MVSKIHRKRFWIILSSVVATLLLSLIAVYAIIQNTEMCEFTFEWDAYDTLATNNADIDHLEIWEFNDGFSPTKMILDNIDVESTEAVVTVLADGALYMYGMRASASDNRYSDFSDIVEVYALDKRKPFSVKGFRLQGMK